MDIDQIGITVNYTTQINATEENLISKDSSNSLDHLSFIVSMVCICIILLWLGFTVDRD